MGRDRPITAQPIPTAPDAADAAGTNRPSGSAPPSSRLARVGLAAVRYGFGVAMVIGGVVLLIVSPAGLGVDGFAMAAGGGLSVLLVNFLYRLGVSGDLEREREEQARAYFDEHGEWPDETAGRAGSPGSHGQRSHDRGPAGS